MLKIFWLWLFVSFLSEAQSTVSGVRVDTKSMLFLKWAAARSQFSLTCCYHTANCLWLVVSPKLMLHKLLSILTTLPVLMALHKSSYLVFISTKQLILSLSMRVINVRVCLFFYIWQIQKCRSVCVRVFLFGFFVYECFQCSNKYLDPLIT